MAEESDESVEPNANNKRRFVRFGFKTAVHIRLSSGELIRAQSVDLSLGGIYVEYGASADKGKIFEMYFDLPFRDDFKRVFVKGEVMRCIIIGGKDLFGIAFNFSEYARQAEQILSDYIEFRTNKGNLT